MTVLGKILVFIILVLALLQAALHIMFHVSQANWVNEYGKLKQTYTTTLAEMVTFQQERDEARADRDKALGELNNTRAMLENQVKDEQTKSVALGTQLQGAKENQNKSDASLAGATTDIQSRQEEVKRLEDAIKDKDKRIGDLVKNNNELRERTVQAEITARTLGSRNQELETRYEDMSKDLIKLKSTGGGTTPGGATTVAAKNPPPSQIEGLITKTDPSGLVTVSIGSDAGLLKGHDLEVFRLSPPKYLGTIRLMDVRANEAVGRPLSKLSGPIQQGDRVASQINW
jgi:hypothetical protein